MTGLQIQYNLNINTIQFDTNTIRLKVQLAIGPFTVDIALTCAGQSGYRSFKFHVGSTGVPLRETNLAAHFQCNGSCLELAVRVPGLVSGCGGLREILGCLQYGQRHNFLCHNGFRPSNSRTIHFGERVLEYR